MFNYHRDFIPNMSSIISPLRDLLKKDISWGWNSRNSKTFNILKTLITTSPTLAHFDHKKNYITTVRCI